MTKRPLIKIICESVHHNNTRLIADTLAEELSGTVHSVEKARTVDLSECDLLGLGSGIYFGRHDRSLLELVETWPSRPCRVFIFSTAGLPFLRWCQHYALRRRLVRRGFEVIGEFCCRGWDTVGPLWLMGGINRRHPNAKDLARARAFGRQLNAPQFTATPSKNA
ncbi:MAG: flavodoxin family protein [Planctomyces sp.]|jgi:flavodoxin